MNNVTIVNLKKHTVCSIPEARNVFFPTKRTLNGKITVVNSSALQDSLIEQFKKEITSLHDIEEVKYNSRV